MDASSESVNQHLCVMSLEVLALTRGGLLPDPAKGDPIVAVAWCIHDDDVLAKQELGATDVGATGRGLITGIVAVAPPLLDEPTQRRIAHAKERGIAVDAQGGGRPDAAQAGDSGEEATCAPAGEAPADCSEVWYVRDETSLMAAVAWVVRTVDPDIVCGWEVQQSSWGLLLERADAIGCPLLAALSRVPAAADDARNKQTGAAGKFDKNTSSGLWLPGRHVLNLWRESRKEVKLGRFTQEDVARHVLGRSLPRFPPRLLSQWLRSGATDRRAALGWLAERARADLSILAALDLVGRSSEMAKIFGIDFFSVFTRGSQFRVEAVMLRVARPRGFLAPSPRPEDVSQQPSLEVQPLILEPQPRLHRDPVVVLDFQSLYPSVIIAHNLCYSTCLGRLCKPEEVPTVPQYAATATGVGLLHGGAHGAHRKSASAQAHAAEGGAASPPTQTSGGSAPVQGRPEAGQGPTAAAAGSTSNHGRVGQAMHGMAASGALLLSGARRFTRPRLGPFLYTPPPGSFRRFRGRGFLSSNGVFFVPRSEREGILPCMLREILATRVMVKRAMKGPVAKRFPELKRVLNARQFALKMLSNVTYGYTAASFSGRMPCIELADTIVQTARDSLDRAIYTARTHPEWRARVVYGDTDSLFVAVDGRSPLQAFAIGRQLVDATTSQNPAPMELKLEKVYDGSVTVTKKRYAGRMIEDESECDLPSGHSSRPVLDVKGLEIIRRDQCGLTSRVMRLVVEELLRSRDLSSVRALLEREAMRVLRGDVPLSDFVFAKEFKSNYSATSVPPPHVVVASKAMAADPRATPRVRERVSFVVLFGLQKSRLVDLVVDPREVLSHPSQHRVHAHYYLRKALFPALNRVLLMAGADCMAWLDALPRRHPRRLDSRLLTARKNGCLDPLGSAFFGFGNPAACCMTADYGLVAAYRAGEVVKFNLKSSRKEWVKRLEGCARPTLCELVEGGRIVVVFSTMVVLLRHDGTQDEQWQLPASWDDCVLDAVLSSCKQRLFLGCGSDRAVCLTTLSLEVEWTASKLPVTDRVVSLLAESGNQLFAVVGTFGKFVVLDGAKGLTLNSADLWPPESSVPGFCTLCDPSDSDSMTAVCAGVWGGASRLFIAFEDSIMCLHPVHLVPLWVLGSLGKTCNGSGELNINWMSAVPAPKGSTLEAGVLVALSRDGSALSVCVATGKLLSCRKRDITSKSDLPSEAGAAAPLPAGVPRPNPMRAAQVTVAPAQASRPGAASRGGDSLVSRSAASRVPGSDDDGDDGDDDDEDRDDDSDDDDDVEEEISRAVIIPAALAHQWGCGPLLERAGPGSPAVVAYMATCDNVGGYSEVFAVPGPRLPARSSGVVRPPGALGDSLAERPAPVEAKLVRSWRALQTGWQPDELHVDSLCGLAVLATPDFGMEVWSLRTGIRLWFRDAKSLALERPVSCEARPVAQLRLAPAAAAVEVQSPRKTAWEARPASTSHASGERDSSVARQAEGPGLERRAGSGGAAPPAADLPARAAGVTLAPAGELVPDPTNIAAMAVAEGSGTICLVLSSSATRCFDSFTGEDLWSIIVCGPEADTDHAFGMRLRDGSHVYAFLNAHGVVHAVDARTGVTRFCTSIGLSADLYNAEASVAAGVIVLTDDNGRIFCVDVNGTGSLVWKLEPFDWLAEQPSVSAMGEGAVLLHGNLSEEDSSGNNPHVIFVLDCTTGGLIWQSSGRWADEAGRWAYDSARKLWIRYHPGQRATCQAVDALTGRIRARVTLTGAGGVAQFATGPGLVGAVGEDGLTLLSSASLSPLTPAPFNAPPSFTQVKLARLRREGADAVGGMSCFNCISGRSGPGFSPLCACTICCRRLPHQMDVDGRAGCCGGGQGVGDSSRASESATHAIVIGSSAEVFIVDIGALLGPMRFGPGIDSAVVSKLGADKSSGSDGGSPAAPRSAIDTAHRILPAFAQRRAVLAPCLTVTAKLALRVILFLQLLLFALQPASPPSLEETKSTLETAQSFGLPSLHPSVPLLVVALALALLAVVFCVSERIEKLQFSRPDSAIWGILWKACRIYVLLVVSLAQVPIWTTLASVVQCESSADSDWLRGVGEACFESPQHILIIVAASVIALAFMVFSVRVLLAKSQLERIELTGLCDDWSGDDRSPEPAQQLLSEASPVLQVCLVFIKVVLSISSVLLVTQPAAFASILVAGSVFQLAVAIRVPPFFSSEGNKLVILETLALAYQNSMALAASLVLEGATGPVDVELVTRMLEWSPLGLVATIVIAAVILARVPAIKPHWKPMLAIAGGRLGER